MDSPKALDNEEAGRVWRMDDSDEMQDLRWHDDMGEGQRSFEWKSRCRLLRITYLCHSSVGLLKLDLGLFSKQPSTCICLHFAMFSEPVGRSVWGASKQIFICHSISSLFCNPGEFTVVTSDYKPAAVWHDVSRIIGCAIESICLTKQNIADLLLRYHGRYSNNDKLHLSWSQT